MFTPLETDLGLVIEPEAPFNAFYCGPPTLFLARHLLIQSIAPEDIANILAGDTATLDQYVCPTGPPRIGFTLKKGARAVVASGANELASYTAKDLAIYTGFKHVTTDTKAVKPTII